MDEDALVRRDWEKRNHKDAPSAAETVADRGEAHEAVSGEWPPIHFDNYEAEKKHEKEKRNKH